MYPKKEYEVIDSIVSETQRTYTFYKNVKREDSIKQWIEYRSNNRIDSVRISYNESSFQGEEIQRFIYWETGFLRTNELSLMNLNGKVIRYQKTNYSQSGLPLSRQYKRNTKNKVESTKTTFKYTYY
ncbi:hypothetical protein SAMN05216474_0043 [Lishizhenia tianjinensis]|uniref:YD repeat-containing protein n=1 Tax=Lishizhenia tianjinensis TaxID=477690 RepID=A0A1I6X9Y6_9FLAO|nr:hypothetical protein SAMN05216474_0043 [Lishizhenia tianjinensis]